MSDGFYPRAGRVVEHAVFFGVALFVLTQAATRIAAQQGPLGCEFIDRVVFRLLRRTPSAYSVVALGLLVLASSVWTPPSAGASALRRLEVWALLVTALALLGDVAGVAGHDLFASGLVVVALLASIRADSTPSFATTLGAWVVVSHLGGTTVMILGPWSDPFIGWGRHPNLMTLAPAYALFQAALALTLWSGLPTLEGVSRRVLAIVALAASVDVLCEAVIVAVVDAPTVDAQVVTGVSWSAQGFCALAALGIAVQVGGALHGALHAKGDLVGFRQASTAGVMTAMAALAPVLGWHSVPWTLGHAVERHDLVDSPHVTAGTTPWTSPVSIVTQDGVLRDARRGEPLEDDFRCLTNQHGLVMSRGATVAEFRRAASWLVDRHCQRVEWVVPRTDSAQLADVVPRRFFTRTALRWQTFSGGVSLHYETGDATSHPSSMPDAPDPATPLTSVRATGGTLALTVRREHLHVPSRPAVRATPDRVEASSRTIRARLVPLITGLTLGVSGFALLLSLSLLALTRARLRHHWIPTEVRTDTDTPWEPAFIPSIEAGLARFEGSPYRSTVVARVASAAAVRAWLVRHIAPPLLACVCFLGVMWLVWHGVSSG